MKLLRPYIESVQKRVANSDDSLVVTGCISADISVVSEDISLLQH